MNTQSLLQSLNERMTALEDIVKNMDAIQRLTTTVLCKSANSTNVVIGILAGAIGLDEEQLKNILIDADAHTSTVGPIPTMLVDENPMNLLNCPADRLKLMLSDLLKMVTHLSDAVNSPLTSSQIITMSDELSQPSTSAVQPTTSPVQLSTIPLQHSTIPVKPSTLTTEPDFLSQPSNSNLSTQSNEGSFEMKYEVPTKLVHSNVPNNTNTEYEIKAILRKKYRNKYNYIATYKDKRALLSRLRLNSTNEDSRETRKLILTRSVTRSRFFLNKPLSPTTKDQSKDPIVFVQPYAPINTNNEYEIKAILRKKYRNKYNYIATFKDRRSLLSGLYQIPNIGGETLNANQDGERSIGGESHNANQDGEHVIPVNIQEPGN